MEWIAYVSNKHQVPHDKHAVKTITSLTKK